MENPLKWYRMLLESLLTWIKSSQKSSRVEVTSCSFVFEFLIIAVERIRGMIFDCVWKITRLIWLNLATVCTISTSPIKSILQFSIWCLLISYAPILKLCIWTSSKPKHHNNKNKNHTSSSMRCHIPMHNKWDSFRISWKNFLPDFCGNDDSKATRSRNLIKKNADLNVLLQRALLEDMGLDIAAASQLQWAEKLLQPWGCQVLIDLGIII